MKRKTRKIKNESPIELEELSKPMTRDEICFNKAIVRDDETFTLVGQDKTSPSVICEWIKQNIETATTEKLQDALNQAIEMRNRRRFAD